jgi:hypothetical protein
MNPTAILAGHGARERILAMSPAARLDAYEHGALTRHELDTWASLFPEEVPLVNGELPWIVATLADLD